MNPGIFRDYDIRALAEEDLTDDHVARIGLAFGTHLIQQGKRSVVLGRDNRLSSVRIARTLSDAILSTGCDVIDVGETATPILCFAVIHLRAGAGAMVTGSHNPPEYNGIKLQIGDRPLHGAPLRELAGVAEAGPFARGQGRLIPLDVLPDYVARVKERVSLDRPLKVVVDCGNGNTGMIALPLFRDLGCEVVPLYCESDGSFPNHHPDPAVAANLRDLCAEVVRTGADLGVAYDGDGNRLGVVDERGEIVPADIVLGLLAGDVIEREGPVKVVCDVKTSQALMDYVESRGGTVLMCRAGYPFILEMMFREGAAIAGELPGHFCFNDELFAFGDAVYVSCRLAQLLARAGGTLSRLLADFAPYFSTPEHRIACPDARKFAAVEEVRRHFAGRYEMLDIDGVRVSFGRGWALIRASNTEPALSVRLEAASAEELEAVKATVRLALRRAGVDCGDVLGSADADDFTTQSESGVEQA
jgi:phosphomannomutase / phosphoglucomutase